MTVTKETREYDFLVTGRHPLSTADVVVAAGEALPRGAVLGKVTATGKYVLSTAAAEDGSQTPTVILAEAVAESVTDTEAIVFISGAFVDAAMTFGTGHSIATTWESLRDKSIYIVAGQGA